MFNDVGHLISVNLDSFCIETVKIKQVLQQPAKRSPELLRFPVLVMPKRKRRFNLAVAKQKDMSLYYGVKPKTATPLLLRRKRKIDLQKLYDFIKNFLSVLVKRPTKETQPEAATGTVPNPAVPDPLDEVIIDPVTKLKITRHQWEAMGTGSKSAEIFRPTDANYIYDSEKKPVANEHNKTVTFPPLPDDAENKNAQTRKITFKLVGRLSFKWKSNNI